MKTENKQAVKNMEYWKKKNNIPGIEALAGSGLTDGKAGSSAFQMATPGDSPNKFNPFGAIGSAIGAIGGGGGGSSMFGGIGGSIFGGGLKEMLARIKARRQAKRNRWKGMTDPNVQKTVAQPVQVPVVGSGHDDIASAGGGDDIALAEDAIVEDGTGITMKKSPMKQEEKEGVLLGQEIAMQSQDQTGNWILDEENGTLRTTDQGGTLPEGTLINDPDDILEGRTTGDGDFNYRYKVEEDGSYTLISKGSINKKELPSQKNVPQGVGPGGMDIRGGVTPDEFK